jgi:hypothetical protein
MIPKIIHFCWLSGETYPPDIIKFLDLWKVKLVDYDFQLWDSERVREIDNTWLKQSVELKKYAFAADYIRLYALYHYGGIYLDVDVELISSFDTLLLQQMFIGLDYNNYFEPAVIGSVPGHYWVKDLLAYYDTRPFLKKDGKPDIRPLPDIFNESAKKKFNFLPVESVQSLNNGTITVYPFDYFSPKSEYSKNIQITTNTKTIHHFKGSWVKKDFVYWIKRWIHQLIIGCGGREFHQNTVKLFRRISN